MKGKGLLELIAEEIEKLPQPEPETRLERCCRSALAACSPEWSMEEKYQTAFTVGKSLKQLIDEEEVQG